MKRTIVLLSLLLSACLQMVSAAAVTAPETPTPAPSSTVTMAAPKIATDAPHDTSLQMTVCNTDVGLNVRPQPQADGKIILTLAPGVSVTVIVVGEWGKIADGKFVSLRYLCP